MTARSWSGQREQLPGKAAKSCEVLGHDNQRKVPGAGSGAGMTGVFGAVVVQLEQCRMQRRQPFAQRGMEVHQVCDGRSSFM